MKLCEHILIRKPPKQEKILKMTSTKLVVCCSSYFLSLSILCIGELTSDSPSFLRTCPESGEHRLFITREIPSLCQCSYIPSVLPLFLPDSMNKVKANCFVHLGGGALWVVNYHLNHDSGLQDNISFSILLLMYIQQIFCGSFYVFLLFYSKFNCNCTMMANFN